MESRTLRLSGRAPILNYYSNIVVFLFTPTPFRAMLFYMEDQTTKQKMITFATSDNAPGAIELLKKCRTQLTSVVSGTEFQTLVNAITLEVESNLIQRLVVAIDNVRQGEPIPD